MINILPFPLACFLAGAFICLLCFTLFLNVFGLPANWLILGLAALWKFAHPDAQNLGLFFWIVMIGLAILGEILETGLQIMKSRRCGSSSSGAFAGMIGAFIGAIMLAPLFFGLGAFLGALAGAFCGCLLMELLRGRPRGEAIDAAMGTMVGHFLGAVCKIGVGAVMTVITARQIWPVSPPEIPEPTLEQTVVNILSPF